MFSKNFIFTSLFFIIIVFCVSCLENKTKKEYNQFYTILPTDSSNFSISLDGIETIKTSNFNLGGKWKLIDNNHKNNEQKTDLSYLTFEGRKIYSILNSDYSNQNKNIYKNDLENKYSVFAIYDKCPDENGTYDKNGQFLVVGSGDEKLTCYKIVSFAPNKMILYDVTKNDKLEFKKVK